MCIRDSEEARRQAQKILADAKSASDAAFDELAELKRQAAAEQFAIDVVLSLIHI